MLFKVDIELDIALTFLKPAVLAMRIVQLEFKFDGR